MSENTPVAFVTGVGPGTGLGGRQHLTSGLHARFENPKYQNLDASAVAVESGR